jgi:hypothetical protein
MCNFILRRPARLGSIRSRYGSRSCRGSHSAALPSQTSNSSSSTSMPTSKHIMTKLSPSSGPRKRSANVGSKAAVSLSYSSGYSDGYNAAANPPLLREDIGTAVHQPSPTSAAPLIAVCQVLLASIDLAEIHVNTTELRFKRCLNRLFQQNRLQSGHLTEPTIVTY